MRRSQHHVRHHNAIRAATRAGALALATMVAACTYVGTELSEVPKWLGVPAPPAFDRVTPPVTVIRGGPTDELLAGPSPSPVPADAVDRVVAGRLRGRLSTSERRELAQASQLAAIAPTGETIAWQAGGAHSAKLASGTASPVQGPFRSVQGRICRDVRQSVDKGEEPRDQQVTLCREDIGNDVYLWVIGLANQ